MITKPMLAGPAPMDLGLLKYPVLITPKIDGIRCLKVGGKAVSRSFKPIRNSFIRKWIEDNLPDGVDGELIVKGAKFHESSSGIMSEYGQPDFEYKVFDFVQDPKRAYELRINDLADLKPAGRMIKVLPFQCSKETDLLQFEQVFLSDGFEGVMIRDPKGPYKSGRSTVKEGWLLKLKRFEDGEAIIVGFNELFHNLNEDVKDAFGHAKRSANQENLRPAGMLGSLTVTDLKTRKVFAIGTGFDMGLRLRIWEHKSEYVNKVVKYKFQVEGTKDLPRIPVFLGFRDPRDLDPILPL